MRFGASKILFAAVMFGIGGIANAQPSTAPARNEALEPPAIISALQNAAEFANRMLPQEKQVDSKLAALTRAAKENGVAITALKTLKPDHAPGYVQLPVEIRMTANYFDFHKFLMAIEGLPGITRLNQVEMQQTGNGRVSIQLGLSMYFSTDPTWAQPQTLPAGTRLQQFQALRDRSEKVQKQLTLVNELMEPMPRSYVVAEIAQAMPSRLTMKDFSLQTKPTEWDSTVRDVTIKTTVSSADIADIRKFTTNLNKLPFLRQAKVATINGRMFGITMKLNADARLTPEMLEGPKTASVAGEGR